MMLVLVVVLVIVCVVLLLRLKQQQARVSALYKSDKMKSHFTVIELAETMGNQGLFLSKGEKKHLAEQINFHTSLMATLLDEVQIYSSGSKGGHQLEDERFSPNRLCERCIDANLHKVQKGVKLMFRQETGQGVFVSSDRHLVELILNKLVVLACRFTKKGEITVGCSFDEATRRLTFVVQDTGDGIPEERQDAMFKWYNNPDDIYDDTEIDLQRNQDIKFDVTIEDC